MTSTSKTFIDYPETVGSIIHELCIGLYPDCRSITGNSVRRTLYVLSEHADSQQSEIPSTKPDCDWTFLDSWNCDNAYVEDPDSRRDVDFKDFSRHSEEIQISKLKCHPDVADDNLFGIAERMFGNSITDLNLGAQRLFEVDISTTLSLADE